MTNGPEGHRQFIPWYYAWIWWVPAEQEENEVLPKSYKDIPSGLSFCGNTDCAPHGAMIGVSAFCCLADRQAQTNAALQMVVHHH